MPEIIGDELGVALDLGGCPNRCRHCYLGDPATARLLPDDLRRTADRFRSFIDSEQNTTGIRRLAVSSWWYEPDFRDDYRELHELERELGDTGPYRYELLSVWRLARDESYVHWAKAVGPRTCQITFFGMEETTDWFCGRQGAFRDALAATERLLEAGMWPRWQLIFTQRLTPELPEFMRLVERLRLHERTAALGGSFDLFLHTPGPDGRAAAIETLRPRMADVRQLPAELVESTRKHFGGRTPLWQTEAELICQILAEEDRHPYAYSYPKRLWLLVKSDWNVFSNLGACEDWWRLGNLRADPAESILGRFRENGCPGLNTVFAVPPRILAERWGNREGGGLYIDADDLLSLYVGERCRAETVANRPDAS